MNKNFAIDRYLKNINILIYYNLDINQKKIIQQLLKTFEIKKEFDLRPGN